MRLNSKLLTLVLSYFVLNGCVVASKQIQYKHPVVIAKGFTMTELLLEAIEVNKQAELKEIMNKPWYAEIAVRNVKDQAIEKVNNCAVYLDNVTSKTHSLNEFEQSALVEIGIMCRATQLLLSASYADSSNIPVDIFSSSTPLRFPKSLALETSEMESIKNANDSTLKYWGDINKISELNNISNEQTEFKHNTGSQILSIVGRGDFNNDQLEDILIYSKDTVSGGTYFNMRLFVLSVDERNNWWLIAMYNR